MENISNSKCEVESCVLLLLLLLLLPDQNTDDKEEGMGDRIFKIEKSAFHSVGVVSS